MPVSIQASACANHPHRTAARTCARCHKPICDRCSVEFVATEQTFCSHRCRDGLPGAPGVDNATLEAGLERPIRRGWALAARSSGRIALLALPIAGAAGLAVGVLGQSSTISTTLLLVLLPVLAAFGVALVGVVLSDRHTGLVEGDAYATAARRFLAWIGTWILIVAITLVGYVALIVPGVYLTLRLFWADEFALIHGKSPFAALRASWELTRKQAADVFLFQFILGFAGYVVVLPAVFVLAFLLAGLEAAGLGGGEAFSGLETFLVFLLGAVVYGALHGPEIVQFYGMRAAKARLAAGHEPIVKPRSAAAVAAIVALVGFMMIGIIAAIAIPNLLNAIDRGKQKRTLADSRMIAIAMESYAEANGRYPEARSIEELERELVPAHVKTILPMDGWGRPFQISSDPTGYEIRSAGKDGVFEAIAPRGATPEFDADIVWQNAELVQWPDHVVFE